MKLLVGFVFLIVCATQTNHMRILENQEENLQNFNSETQANESNHPKLRTKRGVFWDFFQKMIITKNLIVDVSSVLNK